MHTFALGFLFPFLISSSDEIIFTIGAIFVLVYTYFNLGRLINLIKKGQANKDREQARGVADANRIKAASLTPALLEWEKVQKWNGIMPQFIGGGGTSTLLNVNALK